MKIRWDSRAPVSTVLEAIRQDTREWRESVIPAALRSQGVFQVEGGVRGTQFELWYTSPYEHRPDVVLRGAVIARPDGGSQVVASVRRGQGVFALPALLGLVGLWELFHGGGFGLVGLAVVSLVGCVAYAERVSRRDVRDAAYLLERLRHAVDRAGSVENDAPAS